MGWFTKSLISFVALSTIPFRFAQAQIDLTANNRRPQIPGLPDWTSKYSDGFAPEKLAHLS